MSESGAGLRTEAQTADSCAQPRAALDGGRPPLTVRLLGGKSRGRHSLHGQTLPRGKRGAERSLASCSSSQITFPALQGEQVGGWESQWVLVCPRGRAHPRSVGFPANICLGWRRAPGFRSSARRSSWRCWPRIPTAILSCWIDPCVASHALVSHVPGALLHGLLCPAK